MIACVSFDFGFLLLILLAPLGLCYLNSMYEVIRLICDKVELTAGLIARNVICIIICLLFIIVLGRNGGELLLYFLIPLITSSTAIFVAHAKEKAELVN